MKDYQASLDKMVALAARLTEIVNEMKARARKMYPEAYKGDEYERF